MALITCPECNQTVSDKAKFCPHCGCPSRFFKSVSKNENLAKSTNESPHPTNKTAKKIFNSYSADIEYSEVDEYDHDKYLVEEEKLKYLDNYAHFMTLSNDTGWFYPDFSSEDVEIYKDDQGNVHASLGWNSGMHIITCDDDHY